MAENMRLEDMQAEIKKMTEFMTYAEGRFAQIDQLHSLITSLAQSVVRLHQRLDHTTSSPTGFSTSLSLTPFSSQQPQPQQTPLFQQPISTGFGFQSSVATPQPVLPENAQLITQMTKVTPVLFCLADRDIRDIVDAYKEEPGNSKYAFKQLSFSVAPPEYAFINRMEIVPIPPYNSGIHEIQLRLVFDPGDFKRVHFLILPNSGKIQVNGLMVKRKMCFHYLPDSLPLKYVFHGMRSIWFLHVEVCCSKPISISHSSKSAHTTHFASQDLVNCNADDKARGNNEYNTVHILQEKRKRGKFNQKHLQNLANAMPEGCPCKLEERPKGINNRKQAIITKESETEIGGLEDSRAEPTLKRPMSTRDGNNTEVVMKKMNSRTNQSQMRCADSNIESVNGVPPKKGMIVPFQPLAMSFDSVNYFMDMPPEMKDQGVTENRLQLLKEVTGAFKPGVLTALMGVSGAGKTTLMDVFAGRKTSGYIEGDIRISGFPKKQETFARILGYCEQADIHSPQVTIKASLIYSTFLRLPKVVSKEEKIQFVDQVMELVELDNLKDTIVGLPGVTGLSTEPRKRLTIAVELVANPSIIFMDEPTSGLDARAAAIVRRIVRNTVDTGRTVACTIHQPSIYIFEVFDAILLMKRGGQVIYAGPLGRNSHKSVEFFEAIPGVPKIKDKSNPATRMLEESSIAAKSIPRQISAAMESQQEAALLIGQFAATDSDCMVHTPSKVVGPDKFPFNLFFIVCAHLSSVTNAPHPNTPIRFSWVYHMLFSWNGLGPPIDAIFVACQDQFSNVDLEDKVRFNGGGIVMALPREAHKQEAQRRKSLRTRKSWKMREIEEADGI